jgi:hypothetical protein
MASSLPQLGLMPRAAPGQVDVIWDGRSPDEFAFKLDKSDKKAYNQRQMVIIRNKSGTELRGYPEGSRMKETGVV